MRYVIRTPEPRWTGEVAGVAFAHGRGLADDPPARVVSYFRRKGYDVEQLDPVEDAAPGGADPTGSEASKDTDKKNARRGATTKGADQ